jgi:hypothetical protein
MPRECTEFMMDEIARVLRVPLDGDEPHDMVVPPSGYVLKYVLAGGLLHDRRSSRDMTATSSVHQVLLVFVKEPPRRYLAVLQTGVPEPLPVGFVPFNVTTDASGTWVHGTVPYVERTADTGGGAPE